MPDRYLPHAENSLAARRAENANWLIVLRWVAVIGQLITVGVVTLGLGVEIQLAPVMIVIGLIAVSNLLLMAFSRNETLRPPSADAWLPWDRILIGVMLLDLLLLTALLYFSGGPANPFSIFFLVNLSLVAIVLPARWAWLLLLVAIGCLALLFYDHVPVGILQSHERWLSFREAGGLSAAQLGLFAAFVTCAAVVVYFTTRLTGELRRRESELRQAELQRARSEKLEALGTLAAGAAHELATPLSTIAVVAKETQRLLDAEAADPGLVEDIALIRSEVGRCRKILDQMSADAGGASGEQPSRVTVKELIDETLGGLRGAESVDLAIQSQAAGRELDVPLHGLTQALRGVVKNALDAAGTKPVQVSAECQGSRLRLDIRDHGPGMSPEVLARAGEPFFTTKEPGSGMGFGLFLARSVTERIGGTLRLESQLGKGTTAKIELPLAEITS